MAKRFLAGVATADMFRGSQLIGSAKTLLDSSITIGSSAEDVRGGEGMQLFGKYYHTSTFDVALTDVMFKLDYIALQTGSTIKNGADIFKEEQVVLTAGGEGTMSVTPSNIAIPACTPWYIQSFSKVLSRISRSPVIFMSSFAT